MARILPEQARTMCGLDTIIECSSENPDPHMQFLGLGEIVVHYAIKLENRERIASIRPGSERTDQIIIRGAMERATYLKGEVPKSATHYVVGMTCRKEGLEADDIYSYDKIQVVFFRREKVS